MTQPPLIERAFELAKSGEYLSTTDVRDQLHREGYARVQIDEALFGPMLRKQLRELCAQARAKAGQDDVI